MHHASIPGISIVTALFGAMAYQPRWWGPKKSQTSSSDPGLLFDPKQPCSFCSGLWEVTTNPDLLLLLLLVTRLLPRDGGMAEDHGAPEAGQLPRVWTRGYKETESRQRVSGAKSP